MDTRSRPTPRGKLRPSENSKFELKQFHFHTPSEHAIDGKREAMEAHFVHAKEGGDLLVLGVLMRLAAPIRSSPPSWGRAANERRSDAEGASRRDGAFAEEPSFFRYEARSRRTLLGSGQLVCLFHAHRVAASDIETFKGFPDERPPLQPLRRRMLLTD